MWFMQVVAMYQSCYGCRPTTTYQQQVQALAKQGWDIFPHQALLDDLATTISKWNEEGNKIIVLTDFTDDVQEAEFIDFFRIWVYSPSTLPPMENRPHPHTNKVNNQLMVFMHPLHWQK